MPSKNGENVTPSHIMTQTEWEEMMARKVLAYTTDALLVDFRYMGSAFQILQAVPDGQITTLAVDGAKLHYVIDPDDTELLNDIIKVVYACTPARKKKK